MTKQILVETWKESGKYEQALSLLEKTNEIDADKIVSVSVKVVTVNPDSSTDIEEVSFHREFKIVHEDE